MNSSGPLAVGVRVLYVVLRGYEWLGCDKSLQLTGLLGRGSQISSLFQLMFGQQGGEWPQRLSLTGARKHPSVCLDWGEHLLGSPVLQGIRQTTAYCFISGVVYFMTVWMSDTYFVEWSLTPRSDSLAALAVCCSRTSFLPCSSRLPFLLKYTKWSFKSSFVLWSKVE